jgi:chromatin modification-related protein EAF6
MSTLNAIQQRKERLDEELKQVEKQVYDLETTYLNDSSQHGNVIKGFEGFLSQTKSTTLSMSSTSSPVVDEIAAEKAEEKIVTTQSGRRAGGGATYR